MGSQLTAIAVPWFVLQTTGSAARTGLTAFVEALAFFLAGFFGGAFVDRYDSKKVSVASDLASGVGIGLVPLLYHTVGLAFWQLLVLVFVATFLQSPGQSARQRVIPELAALAGQRLERASGATELTYQITFLLGPPLAGLLIGWVGPSDVLVLDAATFVASAGIVAATMPTALIPPRAAATRGRYREELAAGVRFLRADGLLLPISASFALGVFLVEAPLFAVVLPVYANDAFGSATDLGLLISGFAAGGLAGAVAFGAVGHRLPRRALWGGRFLLATAPYWVLALGPSLPVAMAALAVCGVAIGGTNPLLSTVRFERTPAELRGRVFGALRVIGGAAAPLGRLLAGLGIAAFGLGPVVLALAVGPLVLAAGVLLTPAFRLMDAPAPPESASPVADSSRKTTAT